MTNQTFSWEGKHGANIFAQGWQPEGQARGAVALVHGLGEHSGRYQYVAELLNQAGFALYAMDLPGHGQSEGVRGHAAFDEVMDDIDRLIEATQQRSPGCPCFLYGHSMGGAITLYYTLKRRPDLTGVVVTSPGLAPGQPVAQSKLLVARLVARVLPSFALSNGLDQANLCHDEAVIDRYRTDELVHDRVSARLGLDILTRGDWIIAQASAFPLPLLLMQGSADHIVSPKATQAFAEAAPKDKLTYKVWEGMYHETHNEPDKEQVVRYMIGWLEERVNQAESTTSNPS
jgi:alpha-beta hydrolase superfamily lysophospholipase